MANPRTLKDDIERMEGESCGLDGGDCDICGCHFTTTLLNANHCPNCGSKRWDHVATDKTRRLDDCHPWIMEKVKGDKTYQYWMVSWREGDKVRNVHLGSCERMDAETAIQKARSLKKAALGMARDQVPLESKPLEKASHTPMAESEPMPTPEPPTKANRYVKSHQRQTKAMKFVYAELKAGNEPAIQDVKDRFEVDLHIPRELKIKGDKICNTKKGMKFLEEYYYCK